MEGRIAYNIAEDAWRVRIDIAPGRFIDFPLQLTEADREMWRTVQRGLPIHRALAAGAETLSEATRAGAFR